MYLHTIHPFLLLRLASAEHSAFKVILFCSLAQMYYSCELSKRCWMHLQDTTGASQSVTAEDRFATAKQKPLSIRAY